MITFASLMGLLFRKRGRKWPEPNPRRVKLISVTTSVFEELFRTGYRSPHYEVVSGIPSGGRIISGRYDETRALFQFVVASETFPEVPEATLIDDLIVSLRSSTILECPWDQAAFNEEEESAETGR